MLPMPFAPLPNVHSVDNAIASFEDIVVAAYSEIYSLLLGYEQALAFSLGDTIKHLVSAIDSSIAKQRRAVEKSQAKIGDWLNEKTESFNYAVLSAESIIGLQEKKSEDLAKKPEDDISSESPETKAVNCPPPNVLIGGHCAPPGGIIVLPPPPQPCPPGTVMINNQCVDLDDLLPPPPPQPPTEPPTQPPDTGAGSTACAGYDTDIVRVCNLYEDLLAFLQMYFPNIELKHMISYDTITPQMANGAASGVLNYWQRNNIRTIPVSNVPYTPKVGDNAKIGILSESARLLYNYYNVPMEDADVFINNWNTDRLDNRLRDGTSRGYYQSLYEEIISNPEPL